MHQRCCCAECRLLLSQERGARYFGAPSEERELPYSILREDGDASDPHIGPICFRASSADVHRNTWEQYSGSWRVSRAKVVVDVLVCLAWPSRVNCVGHRSFAASAEFGLFVIRTGYI